MNYKYRITNTTAAKADGANKRNLFMTSAGKLIKPGESCYALRIDQQTRNMETAKDISIEEGNFAIGLDLTKPKPKTAAIVDLDDDAPPPPFQPPVTKSADEPLSPREDSAPKVTVSTTGTGKTPVIKDASEPLKNKWTDVPRAKPPQPLAKEDMPERFVMPPREGSEKVATAPAADAKPAEDKGGVKALPPDFDPDNDAPDFGGSDPGVTGAVSTSTPSPSPKGGKKSKG